MTFSQTFTGQIDSVLFANPDSGFVVLRFTVDNAAEPIIVVGSLLGAVAGQPLRITGHWENNRNFGKRFRFIEASPVRPTTDDAIRKYLGSGMIPGIGPVMAKRIVSHFKDKTLDVLDTKIDLLLEVSGIGSKTFKKINAAWERHKASRDLVMLCQEIGISPSFAGKIADKYGPMAEKLIRENPFQLALDIKGVGFLSADKIAENLGIENEHPGRVRAGLVHILEQAGSEGNVALPERLLVDRTTRLLSLESDFVRKALDEAVDQDLIITDNQVAREPYQYEKQAYLIECRLAGSLRRLQENPGTVRKIDESKALEWVEKRLDIQLADAQKQAVAMAIQSKMAVITGGPGTGKTTLIRAIIEVLEALGQKVALAAPTGRAAKRMAESTKRPASTIHRLLSFNPRKGGFEFSDNKRLPFECVIVDESSMLDQWLAEKLVRAIDPSAKLVLVGDVDQLPSVGPGNVLSDVIASKKAPCVRLTEIFRQDSAGLIVQNAHRINSGQKPLLPDPKQEADFYFLTEDDPVALKDLICSLVVNRLPSGFDLDPVRDIQVITPMHRGEAGVTSLNKELQQKLNPTGPSIARGDVVFRVGDKVMQTVNDYDLEVFNGDIGRVVAVQDNGLVVRFDEGEKKVTPEKVKSLALAYALSVHKSQGSEYPAVVIPLSTQHYILLQRNLLYTAVTRAKRLVVLVGSWTALFQALDNDRPAHRYTGLAARMGFEKGECLF